MEFEKPYRSGGNSNSNTSSSELFICFTSRPSFSSSASMKLGSKPICSPGRGDNKFREQPSLSFSSSLNRRHGNSMKAGQSSPMFKKRGCGGFENAEPSSPKVTCIGQVRVKTKKQGKKMMSGILQEKKERGSSVSNCSPQRNQKWVHLPLTICEALRGIGAEFNCFLPCGRSCSSRGRGEKRRSMSSCGAAFAKWLMALQDGEEEKGREIRVIVGEDEKIEKGNEKEGVGIVEYEEERLSICIPPRNALLLMRCRSEPLRMQALANRFWESPVQDDEDSEDDENEEVELGEEHERDDLSSVGRDNEDEQEYTLKEQCSTPAEMVLDCAEAAPLSDQEEELVSAEFVEEPEEHTDSVNEILEFLEAVEQLVLAEFINEQEENCDWGLAEMFREHVEETPLKDQCDGVAEDSALQEHSEEEVSTVKEQEEQQCDAPDINEETEMPQEEEEPSEPKIEEPRLLPDCLLMMLCEPKLSMEVSKETWVCSTDFIQPRSRNKDIKKADTSQQRNEKSFGIGMPPCPAPSMTSMIEQKLMKAVAYEPFVLTRCKSEPLRTSAKLVPEACFWNNPHVEPPPRVGF